MVYNHHQEIHNQINYLNTINLIQPQINQIDYDTYISVKDCACLLQKNSYQDWLKKEKIDLLSISNLEFKQKPLGNLFLEIKSIKFSQQDSKKLLKLVNKYLSIYLYHQLESKLILETEKLKEAKTEQGKYLSHMNHELRTPIAAVIGFAKMLQQKLYGDLNPKQAQYVDAIYQSGTYLLDLISDLLDVSKIQANKEELSLEKVVIRELCDSALALVKTKAEEQGLQLNLSIESGIQTCYADQRRLKQVLVNLLSNAVKFTEQGSVSLEVTKENKSLLFKVIDTGIGIDPQSQEKLFKPFAQLNTHLHRKHKGTGLGLVISRELIKLHGGDIVLTSAKDKGSCFTVYLPLKKY